MTNRQTSKTLGLQNYRLVEAVDEDGERGEVPEALQIHEIAQQIYAVTGGWPRRVGSTLFADTADGIRWLPDHVSLFAWLHGIDKVKWKLGSDAFGGCFVTRQELHAHLVATARAYGTVSEYPMWPARAEVYTAWTAPHDYVPTGEYLDNLLSRFKPATDIDASLIRAFVLTLGWGGPPGSRPAFIVTGGDDAAQASGKTALVRHLCSLFGGAFEPRLGSRGFGDDLKKQLVSQQAQLCRACNIDNAEGVMADPALADVITSESIDGRPAYGEQTRRTNHITWAVTTNDCSMSADLASRSVVIQLAAPDRDADPEWDDQVRAFIGEHRDRILADIIAGLQGTRHAIVEKRTRFAAWCGCVLALDQRVNEILPVIARGVERSDADADEIARFLDELNDRRRPEYQPESERLSRWGPWAPRVLASIWNAANGSNLSVGWVVRRLNLARKQKRLGDLKPASRQHGAGWVIGCSDAG